MASLKHFLEHRDYYRVDLELTLTQHLLLKAKINGVEGRFILDTGASSTCISSELMAKFNLSEADHLIEAAGAGDSAMQGRMTAEASLSIAFWKEKLPLVLFDLSHVNAALIRHKLDAVDGIIGADVLMLGDGIIDYKRKRLYLKKRIYKKSRPF
jgi:hypothetical protein